MGLFSRSEEQEPPGRSAREHCWEQRDIFFRCLDRNNVIDATDPKQAKTIKRECGSELVGFEKNCAKSWVSYFKQKRLQDYKKEKFLEEMDRIGAQKIDMSPDQMAAMNQIKK